MIDTFSLIPGIAVLVENFILPILKGQLIYKKEYESEQDKYILKAAFQMKITTFYSY
jgi:hypothetical protein